MLVREFVQAIVELVVLGGELAELVVGLSSRFFTSCTFCRLMPASFARNVDASVMTHRNTTPRPLQAWHRVVSNLQSLRHRISASSTGLDVVVRPVAATRNPSRFVQPPRGGVRRAAPRAWRVARPAAAPRRARARSSAVPIPAPRNSGRTATLLMWISSNTSQNAQKPATAQSGRAHDVDVADRRGFCSSQAYISRVHGLVNDSCFDAPGRRRDRRPPSSGSIQNRRLIAVRLARPARAPRPAVGRRAAGSRAARPAASARRLAPAARCAGKRRLPATGARCEHLARVPCAITIAASMPGAPSPVNDASLRAASRQRARIARRRLDAGAARPRAVRRRAPQTPRRARRPSRWRRARPGSAAAGRALQRASASSAEMPTSGFPVASASPCIVAMPMRSPVNDPGPVATANRSTSASASAVRVEQRASRSPGSRSPCVTRRVARHARDSSAPSRSERAAARAGRGVEGENQHVKFKSYMSHAFDALLSLHRPRHAPPRVTPAMRQYLDAKQQYRDAIVFFRMGDFYEMFYEDALVAARALDLTLTSRSKDAGGNGHPDVRRALSRRRRLHRAAGARRATASRSASRSRIRRRPRASSSARSCASCRRAR